MKTSQSFQYIRRYLALYLFILPSVLYLLVFNYYPMYGIIIAFKKFSASLGIWGSPWVGFEHFNRFFQSPYFTPVFMNTLLLSLYSLVWGFPFPILLAIMLHHIHSTRYKKFVQTITYAPHFISTVVLVGMLFAFLSPSSGIINLIAKKIGLDTVNFMAKTEYFRGLYVFSGIWQNCGWGAIIYIGVLTSINPELYEATDIDGASKWKQVWYIDIPHLLPTAIILLILNFGKVMSVGFEKVYLMQTPTNISISEIISTYVYKTGLLQAQYSFSAAVGLFNSVINLTLLVLINAFSRRLTDTSLF